MLHLVNIRLIELSDTPLPKVVFEIQKMVYSGDIYTKFGQYA